MSSKKIDIHVHIVHEELCALAADKVVINGFGARKPAPRLPGSRRDTNFRMMLEPALHIEAMIARGVDAHVLSSSTVVQGTWWADPESELRLCRMMNERIAEWVEHDAARFIGTIVLPFQDLTASLTELTRCVNDHGFKIVNAPSVVQGEYLGSSRFDEYWKVAESLGILTYIHPEGVTDPWFQEYSLWNSVGQPIEEAKVMSSLIYSGIFDRFPKVQVAISHGGGYLPHYIGRLDRNVHNMPESTKNISRPPSEYLKLFYYDTCVYDPTVLDRLASVVGTERLLLGSDFPFGDSDPYAVVDASHLCGSDKAAIWKGNAAALLQKIGAI
jgi:aminocarboxymuconate-semialdehyde decarboxylase